MRPFILGFTLLAATTNLCVAHDGTPGHDHSHDGHNHAPVANSHDSDEHKGDSPTDYFWMKSDEAFHAGDYERVLRLHKAIVALDPKDTESYAAYAWIAWSMGNNQEARDHIERGLKANPESWEMWQVAAGQYQFMKLWPQAQNAYASAIRLAPKEENTQMLRRQLAHTAQNAGDLQTAAETWRGLVKDFPNEDVNKNNLARVEKMIADKAKAPMQTSKSDVGRFIMTSAGFLGALIVPALMHSRSKSTAVVT